MFVRFVIRGIDGNSGRRQGVFKTAYRLRRSGELPRELHEDLEIALNWFDENLKAPDRFTRGERRHAKGMAISWFKDSAVDCVRQLRTICRVLDEHGIPTEMLTSTRPGYVVFEDQQQIAAVPFSDTSS
jgi:hypothetical protein